MTGWVTNNPDAARLLHKVDKRFETDMNVARGQMSLASKLEKINEAKARRQRGYDEVATMSEKTT